MQTLEPSLDKMKKAPLSKVKIESKIAYIRESLTELEKLSEIEEKEFINDKKNFAVAEHYLRRALEAVFDISGHIVSRFPLSPGKRPDTYKGLVDPLVNKNIIDEEFGKVLIKMAGYRNRMVHFYDEITDKEMYSILQNHLTDIENFAKKSVRVLENPEKFDLELIDD